MMDKEWKLAARIIIVVFLLLISLWFLNKTLWIISLVAISFLIVYAIAPLVKHLEKLKTPPLLAVFIVYFSFLLSIVLFLYLIIPTITNELRELVLYFSEDYNLIVVPFFADVESFILTYNLADSIEWFLQEIPTYLQDMLNQTVNFTRALFSRIIEILIVLFLVFYLLRDMEKLKESTIKVFPLHLQKEVRNIIEIIDDKVGAYLRGNFLRCGLVGILTGIGLLIFGMPFSFMLGVLAGVLNIIVYIGPYIAAIPAVLLSLSANTPNPLIIIVFYLTVQAIDAFILTPNLLGKAVDLNPFTVIIALMIGATMLGILGIILAIPVAATLKVIIKHYYLKEKQI